MPVSILSAAKKDSDVIPLRSRRGSATLTVDDRRRPCRRSMNYCFRRLTRTVYYAAFCAGVFILFLTLYPHINRTLRPQPESSPVRSTLRPGEFVDVSRHTLSPDDAQDSIAEPDEVGTSHGIRNKKFYLGGTLSLTTHDSPQTSHPEPVIYDPYPVNDLFRPCLGPRDEVLRRDNAEDMTHVYRGNQKGFPSPMFGSYEAINLDDNVCSDRYSRLGAYGYSEDSEAAIPGFERPSKVDWDNVDWGTLQDDCVVRNAHRYLANPNGGSGRRSQLALSLHSTSPPFERYEARSAVLVHSWHKMTWTPNHKQYLRALIMELSLHSGGEYEVFLMIDVKDDDLVLSEAETEFLKDAYIPHEFHNMTVFYNNQLLETWYSQTDEHSAEHKNLQSMQIFSQTHPSFDYYWQVEMDSRNTGHMYHFFDRAVDFAKKQPRKYLWERNAYFYMPAAHGSWEDFSAIVDESMNGTNKTGVWGPVVPATPQGQQPITIGPTPPVSSSDEDNFSWGVGEDADLITFLPIFNPENTGWTNVNMTWSFPQGTATPRRASVSTMSRISKRLLDTMHHDQTTNGLALASEMSAPTWALHHGLKAVYVPHPLFVDGQWSASDLASILNQEEMPDDVDGGVNSIWDPDHPFNNITDRISYMFEAQAAEDLFRRWLGYTLDVKRYTSGKPKRSHGRFWYERGILHEDTYGRLCFPPMLLHKIENTAEVKWRPPLGHPLYRLLMFILKIFR